MWDFELGDLGWDPALVTHSLRELGRFPNLSERQFPYL